MKFHHTPEQMKAAQRKGGRAHGRPGQAIYMKGLSRRIRDELAKGDATIAELAQRLNAPADRVGGMVRQMCYTSMQICRIGKGRGPKAVYALVRKVERTKHVAQPASGNAAPSRTYTWKPLKRDFFAHMRLAMEARK